MSDKGLLGKQHGNFSYLGLDVQGTIESITVCPYYDPAWKGKAR
ncbi:hypothetical protein [uncultured Bacteroides sp.]|nr:hypothetical protein [uncultured Bacteroides sp.]